LDEGKGHARLVKQDTSPDMEGVGRIFLEVLSQSRRLYFLYCLVKECSNPAAGDKEQRGFLGSVTGKWHAVRLCKTAGSHDHFHCSLDEAYCRVLCICREFDLLAILTVLLDAPGDLYGRG
jgi:hypothetical protein